MNAVDGLGVVFFAEIQPIKGIWRNTPTLNGKLGVDMRKTRYTLCTICVKYSIATNMHMYMHSS